MLDRQEIDDCKNQEVKKIGFVVGKVEASSFNEDWDNHDLNNNEEVNQEFRFVASLQWMKKPLLSTVNAYHGECYHVNSAESSKECGITKAVLKKCFSDEDVTKGGGLNPKTFNINRYEVNWKEKEGYAAWENKDFSRRAREACETIIYMPCEPGKFRAGQFIKDDIVWSKSKYQLETMTQCKVLIEAANSAGYQLMIVESNWFAVPRVQKAFVVFDTKGAIGDGPESLWNIEPKGFYEEQGHAWFFCKCKENMDTQCKALKGGYD